MSNQFDISAAVTDVLYDMRDLKNGSNYARDALVLPAWSYTDQEGNPLDPRTYTPLPFPGPDDSLHPREFEIVEPGQIIGADDMHETWICYEPMETRYDYGANAGSGSYRWSAHGGGMIRLCCVSGGDKAEALQITASNVWDRFRNGKVLSASPVNVVCVEDPRMNPIMVDNENKLLVSMKISLYARPS